MVRHADWKEFDTRLKGYMSAECEQPDVDSGVLDLATSVLASAEFSMPRAVGKESRTKWWTRELEFERIHVKRARRRLQRAGDPSVRESRLRDYRRARNRYFAAVKRAKREAWEKFVTEEGNKDPWLSLIHI